MHGFSFGMVETGLVNTLILSGIDKLPACTWSFPCSGISNMPTAYLHDKLSKAHPGEQRYQVRSGLAGRHNCFSSAADHCTGSLFHFASTWIGMYWRFCEHIGICFQRWTRNGLDGEKRICPITAQMTLWKTISPALHQSLSSDSSKISTKVGFLLVNMKVLDPQQIRSGVPKANAFCIAAGCMCKKKYFVMQGIYELSFASKTPFHRHVGRIIEKLMIYIVSPSVNFGHALDSLYAECW